MGKEKKKQKRLEGVELELPKFQMSYPYLFEQATYEGEKVGYMVDALFAKDEDLTPIKKAIFQVKAQAFGKDKAKWPKVVSCLKDGDEKEDAENYADHYFIKLKSKKRRPIVLDKKRNEVEDEAEVYGGRYATAAVRMVIVKSGATYYVAAYIQAIMLLEDAEPFGGGKVDTEKYFKAHEGEDDADKESNYEDDDNSDDDDDIY